jgi:prevent-host-death family protein
MVMNSVGIAELKAKLSEYLHLVRRGRSITVHDRNTPIARIVPIESAQSKLLVRRPMGRTRFAAIPLPPPFDSEIDVVELLLEERQGER